MHRQIWVDVFLMYNTSHQDPLLRNDYFPEAEGAAILTAK